MAEGYKDRDSSLDEAVINCFNKHNGNYGRVRIHHALLNDGIRISEWKIACILKKHGLVTKMERIKRKARRKAIPPDYLSENLVKDKYAVKEKNKLWCADITEMKCAEGKLYVSGVLDVATRKIVGWKIDSTMRQSIVQEAIEMAYQRYKPAPGLIFHCDRGRQYTAKDTKKQLDKYKMLSSMSRPGTPQDNQPIENFWKTLKHEVGDLRLLSFKEAKLKIVHYMEVYYNGVRLHKALEQTTPNKAWIAEG